MDARLTKAARNHCDAHRRHSDARREAELRRGELQARRNAVEWIRRAWLPFNNYALFSRLYDQAAYELAPYGRTIDDLHINGHYGAEYPIGGGF
jgi:hypothetical protein